MPTLKSFENMVQVAHNLTHHLRSSMKNRNRVAAKTGNAEPDKQRMPLKP
jgi:hypothetical protein